MLASLLDLDRHPVDRPDSAGYAASLQAARDELAETGCAIVPGLVRPEALQRMVDEAKRLRDTVHFSTMSINPYFAGTDPKYPARHPVNTIALRSSGFIPGDAFAADSEIDEVFRSPEVVRFIAAALGLPEIHPYADPLAGLTVNVLDQGQTFPWHFDNNDFAITVLLEEADGGGTFEYAPNIRTKTDEQFEDVQEVLEGDRSRVIELDLRPGDMQIFRGRFSLHRVTHVDDASRSRYAAILAYTEEPGIIGTVERTTQLFGRVTQAHLDAEAARSTTSGFVS